MDKYQNAIDILRGIGYDAKIKIECNLAKRHWEKEFNKKMTHTDEVMFEWGYFMGVECQRRRDNG